MRHIIYTNTSLTDHNAIVTSLRMLYSDDKQLVGLRLWETLQWISFRPTTKFPNNRLNWLLLDISAGSGCHRLLGKMYCYVLHYPLTYPLLACKLHVNSHTVDQWSHHNLALCVAAAAANCVTRWSLRWVIWAETAVLRHSFDTSFKHVAFEHVARSTLHAAATSLTISLLSQGSRRHYAHSDIGSYHRNHRSDKALIAMRPKTSSSLWDRQRCCCHKHCWTMLTHSNIRMCRRDHWSDIVASRYYGTNVANDVTVVTQTSNL